MGGERVKEKGGKHKNLISGEHVYDLEAHLYFFGETQYFVPTFCIYQLINLSTLCGIWNWDNWEYKLNFTL